MNKVLPLVLIILDGWGHRDEKDFNAIAQAHTPVWNDIWKNHPHTLISGSGTCVGLPQGQMGNSEVGHLTMGAGRIIHQDLTKIDMDIESGNFYKNTALKNALLRAKSQSKAVHVMGLLSPGGVHSHENHFFALINMAAQLNVSDIYIHAFLDGRDTPPQSAEVSLNKLENVCKELHCGSIASIVGRYYAMDRDQRWNRIAQAYQLLTDPTAPHTARTAIEGLHHAYARGENDEFVQPTRVTTSPHGVIQDDDVVIFMNFRADRARELTRSLIEHDFNEFPRKHYPRLSEFVCLTQYDETFKTSIAYPNNDLKNIFAEYVSQQGLKQLRIAETEKYAHVTYFFNGGKEQSFPGEKRILIPSPKVATYDLQPAMSAYELTAKLISEIKNAKYDVIICNFANPDMVGHTGNFAAAIKAIEVIDECLGNIIAAQQAYGGEIIITADHGNAEFMYDPKIKQPHTAHTSSLVPFIYIGRNANINDIKGKLSDIAPTMLYLLGLTIPKEMTGQTLLALA